MSDEKQLSNDAYSCHPNVDDASAVPIIREPKIDPTRPPLPSQYAEFWTSQSYSDYSDSSSEEDTVENLPLPFEEYVPTREDIIEVLHEVISKYQPAFVCAISAKMASSKEPKKLVEMLRNNEEETRLQIEETLKTILDCDQPVSAPSNCSSCTGQWNKNVLRQEFFRRVETRHPFQAEDIVDVNMDEPTLDTLYLLMFPKEFLADLIETVDGQFLILNARPRRKLLREDLALRIRKEQPNKYRKVLALIIKKNDETELLNVLRYPELLRIELKLALEVVIEKEKADQKLRNERTAGGNTIKEEKVQVSVRPDSSAKVMEKRDSSRLNPTSNKKVENRSSILVEECQNGYNEVSQQTTTPGAASNTLSHFAKSGVGGSSSGRLNPLNLLSRKRTRSDTKQDVQYDSESEKEVPAVKRQKYD